MGTSTVQVTRKPRQTTRVQPARGETAKADAARKAEAALSPVRDLVKAWEEREEVASRAVSSEVEAYVRLARGVHRALPVSGMTQAQFGMALGLTVRKPGASFGKPLSSASVQKAVSDLANVGRRLVKARGDRKPGDPVTQADRDIVVAFRAARTQKDAATRKASKPAKVTGEGETRPGPAPEDRPDAEAVTYADLLAALGKASSIAGMLRKGGTVPSKAEAAAIAGHLRKIAGK